MLIIKEYCPDAKICIIRTDTYSYTLQHILDLAEEAKKDFSGLSHEKINVIKCGGKRYRGTFGILFRKGNNRVPDCYEKVRWSEIVA